MSKKYTAEDIKSFSVREAVRKRPKLYFQQCWEENSLDALPFEALCHALDEHLEGNCPTIRIQLHENAFQVDYVAGLSLAINKQEELSLAEIIFTQIRACSNLKKHLSVGDAHCKTGMAALNFVAHSFTCTTIWNNKKGSFVFEKGLLLSSSIIPAEGATPYTSIYIQPDISIFEQLPLTLEGIKSKALDLEKQYPNLTILIE